METMTEISQDAHESLDYITELERIIREKGKRHASRRTVTGEKELANAIKALTQLESDIGQMKVMMQGVDDMIGKVNDGEEKVSEKSIEETEKLKKVRGELESTVAQLETRLAEARATAQSIIGVDRLATLSNN